MNIFLIKKIFIKMLEEYEKKYKDILIDGTVDKYIDKIEEILLNINETMDGNCFYLHNWGPRRAKGGLRLERVDKLIPKQINLFWAGHFIDKKICEIGFNAGHSALLFLLASNNINFDFLIFDIYLHNYTSPCFEFLKNEFKNVNWEMIKGDSYHEMSNWIEKNSDKIGTFDVVHVDGNHIERYVKNDIIYANKLLKIEGILIIDDVMLDYINKYVDILIESKKYVECEIKYTPEYPHRILKKKEFCENIF